MSTSRDLHIDLDDLEETSSSTRLFSSSSSSSSSTSSTSSSSNANKSKSSLGDPFFFHNDDSPRSLHHSISTHLSEDWNHPKRLLYLIQYTSAFVLLLCTMILPFLPRSHYMIEVNGKLEPHIVNIPGDAGFGRNWLSLLFLFHAIHQIALAYANQVSLKHQQHDIEYYEHSFYGVVAWAMGGLCHIARLCLVWDVLRSHGPEAGKGTMLMLLCSFFTVLFYFAYAYRASLAANVAAYSGISMNLLLSCALIYASNHHHVAPNSALGAIVGLVLFAALQYPMMSPNAADNQERSWIFEIVAIVIWIWLIICYAAFDNCVA